MSQAAQSVPVEMLLHEAGEVEDPSDRVTCVMFGRLGRGQERWCLRRGFVGALAEKAKERAGVQYCVYLLVCDDDL
jgi:hypothetical protein